MEIEIKKEVILKLTEEEAREINLALGNTIAKMQSLSTTDINMPTVLVELQNSISENI